jgi:hypothetical protein
MTAWTVPLQQTELPKQNDTATALLEDVFLEELRSDAIRLKNRLLQLLLGRSGTLKNFWKPSNCIAGSDFSIEDPADIMI